MGLEGRSRRRQGSWGLVDCSSGGVMNQCRSLRSRFRSGRSRMIPVFRERSRRGKSRHTKGNTMDLGLVLWMILGLKFPWPLAKRI